MFPLESKLCDSWPPQQWQDVTTLVAVSGGADSVALLRALIAARTFGEGRLVAAHFNHRLRGEASHRDAAFVRDLCQSLGVELRLGEASTSLEQCEERDGLEAAARWARYDFLVQEAHAVGARYVATAHTADDQAETILHRILRGTGVGGLAGIPRTRQLSEWVTVIRPLLTVRRTEILAYLQALSQSFCDDASNQDPKFTRNRIRHQLLPKMAAEFNPLVVETLLRLGELASQTQELVESVVEDLATRAVRVRRSDFVEIDCQALLGQSEHVVRELFVAIWKWQRWPARDMTFERWESLAALARPLAGGVDAGGRALSLPGQIVARRMKNLVTLQWLL